MTMPNSPNEGYAAAVRTHAVVKVRDSSTCFGRSSPWAFRIAVNDCGESAARLAIRMDVSLGRSRQPHADSPRNLLDAATGAAASLPSAHLRVYSGLLCNDVTILGRETFGGASAPIPFATADRDCRPAATGSLGGLRPVVFSFALRDHVLNLSTSTVDDLGSTVNRALVTSA